MRRFLRIQDYIYPSIRAFLTICDWLFVSYWRENDRKANEWVSYGELFTWMSFRVWVNKLGRKRRTDAVQYVMRLSVWIAPTVINVNSNINLYSASLCRGEPMLAGSPISEYRVGGRAHSAESVGRRAPAAGRFEPRHGCLGAVAHQAISVRTCRPRLCCCWQLVSDWEHKMLQLLAVSQRSTTAPGKISFMLINIKLFTTDEYYSACVATFKKSISLSTKYTSPENNSLSKKTNSN